MQEAATAATTTAAADTAAGRRASLDVEDTLRQELAGQREVGSRLRADLAAARAALEERDMEWEVRGWRVAGVVRELSVTWRWG